MSAIVQPPELPHAFYADRWGNRWSEKGVQLHFGNGRLGTSVELGPQAVAVLSRQLQCVIAELEDGVGTLWSEDAAELGKFTQARLQWPERPFQQANQAMVDKLFLLVKNLPLTGFERSFKFLNNEVRSDRFLVGISSSSLAASDLDFLAKKLAAPELFRAAFGDHLPQATFIHIGFEHGKRHSNYKLYFEFSTKSERGDARSLAQPLPLYVGYKWNPADSAQRTVSTYSQPAHMTLNELLKTIAAAYGNAPSPWCEAASEVITLGASCAGNRCLTYVKVTDDNSSRMSFDVNLYACGLRVNNLTGVLQALVDRVGLPKPEFTNLMAQAGADLAGHISGGLDRDRRPFLTIYHACTDNVARI